MKQTIRFKLFGDICALDENQKWKPITDFIRGGLGKKQLAFLIYLLLNHERKISSTELMETFWSEDSKDPANSLKNMMHKIRTLLRGIYPDAGELILTSSGGYEWSPDMKVEVDAELFEQLYQESKNMRSAEEYRLKQKAFELYDGEILPGVDYAWLAHRNIYLQTIYIDICKSLVMQYLEEQRWDEVTVICDKAYVLAPEIEEFTTCAMQALIQQGLPGQAIKHYEDYCAVIWERFNLPPSGAVEKVHALAVHTVYNTEDTIERIITEMSTLEEEHRAFQCSQLVFQNMVQLELRQMLRNKHESSLAILSLESYDLSAPSATNIRRVERTLQTSLRAGDPFTRLNQGTFILLLAGASEENSHKVMQRIQKNFYGSYPRSNTTLNYTIHPLSVGRETEKQQAAGKTTE